MVSGKHARRLTSDLQNAVCERITDHTLLDLARRWGRKLTKPLIPICIFVEVYECYRSDDGL